MIIRMLILIATGSEVALAVSAKTELENESISVRVVAMPSWELFNKQSKEYKSASCLLPFQNESLLKWEFHLDGNAL